MLLLVVEILQLLLVSRAAGALDYTICGNINTTSSKSNSAAITICLNNNTNNNYRGVPVATNCVNNSTNNTKRGSPRVDNCAICWENDPTIGIRGALGP